MPKKTTTTKTKKSNVTKFTSKFNQQKKEISKKTESLNKVRKSLQVACKKEISKLKSKKFTKVTSIASKSNTKKIKSLQIQLKQINKKFTFKAA
jgi:hypothetical protein